MGEDLSVLQEEFPGFRIWQEQMQPGRMRYVACSRRQGVNPHTVITADIGELREALRPGMLGDDDGERMFSAAEPNIARMYAYWLQGKDHSTTGHAAASKVLERFPEVAEVARANRSFLTRAVRYLADQGITQFIDIGSGLPVSPNVHETARTITPGARVVYVDRDPVVLARTRARVAVDENIGVVAGDIRDPARLLRAVARMGVIDSIRPAGVLLTSLLHFLTAAEADAAVAVLREWMAPGSYLVISAGTSTGTDPELIRLLQDVYGGTAPVTGRTEAEIAGWFDGLALVEPGLADVWAWRPDTWRRPATARARFLAGVGRKPTGPAEWSP